MISYYHFQLPFRTPFKTGSGEFSFREGVILNFRDDKLNVLAEASPLPGFSRETVENVIADLKRNNTILDEFLKVQFTLADFQDFLDNRNDSPSIQFAISDLGRKILQYRRMMPENHPLFRTGVSSVSVNEIVGYHDSKTVKKLILSALKRGFNTIKIKTPSPDPTLAKILREIYAQHVNVKFRLDANQNWDVEKLQIFNTNFQNLPIEYIEEPFAMNSDEDIARASSISDYPIAMDESIINLKHLKKLLKHHPNQYVILKPMLLGNIFDISETLSEHRSSYERVVITSSLESEVGLETTSFLAAAMGDHKRAHGLNTGHLFPYNLITKNEIRNGFIDLTHALESPITMDQIDSTLLTLL